MNETRVSLPTICLLLLSIGLVVPSASAENFNTGLLGEMAFHLPPGNAATLNAVSQKFDGFTSHWERFSWRWYTHSGLFQTSRTDPLSDLQRVHDDVGNQLLLDELWIQKGFVNRLANADPGVLFSPAIESLETEITQRDVLLLATDREPGLATLLAKLPEELQFRRNRAFYLERGGRTLFVISCQTREETHRLHEQIHAAARIVKNYDLSKGIAGVQTNHFLITPGVGRHPLDLTALMLQLDVSWMALGGYNDFLIPEKLNKSLAAIDFHFPCISGQSGTGGVMYGMHRYPDIQDNTLEQCLDWTDARDGFFFADVSSMDSDSASRFDGYILKSPSDWSKIQEKSAPFITAAGTIERAAPPAMVLLLAKGETLTQESIMRAITGRRCIAVFADGVLAGPKEYLDPFRILMLESAYLESQFGAHTTLEADVDNGQLTVSVRNNTPDPLSGSLTFQTPEGVWIEDRLLSVPLSLSAYETRQLHYDVHCAPSASGGDRAVAVSFDTPVGGKRALARFRFPQAVEIHPLVFETPGNINYPVTIWNYTGDDEVNVDLNIHSVNNRETVHTGHISFSAAQWNKTSSQFQFRLPPGDYVARVSALGVSAEGKIAVRKQRGRAVAREEDLNNDGIPEIVLENDDIRATILLFGGRVIEYIVKSKDENLLFKLWPEKPPWHGEPRGVRAFYPYGGLEEFLGYPFIGGHIVYQYEIERAGGDAVRVRLWANVHGSRIEKVVTLAAGSPILEARYALNDITPTISVIGINPLFQIGPSTGPEDIYYFPTEDEGLLEKRPEIERYYGATLFLREGWAAGYDTEMDLSLVVGYPVNDAMLMHMWNNHPNNTPTPYYYTELQPWVEIKQETTTYFSYYIFGREGDWRDAVDDFRKLGLVTKKE